MEKRLDMKIHNITWASGGVPKDLNILKSGTDSNHVQKMRHKKSVVYIMQVNSHV